MAKKGKSKILTIMFIDIVGYTNLSTRLDRDKFEKLNEKFDEIALPIMIKHHGWVVKKIGDCFMVGFESSTDSLICAKELQNKFRDYNLTKPEVPIKIKIAVNSGEVLIKDDDVYGEAVNAVARIEKETKPGQIVFSDSVFLSMNKGEIPYIYLGKKKMKGLKYPMGLFRVKSAEEDMIKRRRAKQKDWSKILKWIIFLILLNILGFVLYKLL